MQKKLLTLAVAGALAAPAVSFAQSSVEVYGYINMSLGYWRHKDATDQTAFPDVSKFDVSSSATNVGVRGREALGGGLSAWFQIESNVAMERSNNTAHTSGFASRNSAVGLQGSFGNVFIGQWTSPWADLDALWAIGTVGGYGPVTSIIGRRETTGAAPNANCTNKGSGTGGPTGACDSVVAAGGVGHPFWRRMSNSVFYQSPVVAGGLQAKLAYQVNQDKTNGGTGVTKDNAQMWSSSLQWSGMGGKARVGVAYDRHKDFTTIGSSDNGVALKGGFNFGVVDVGAAYERMTYKTTTGDCKATQYGLAAAVPVGQGAVRGSWSKAKDITGCTVAALDNGATEYNLGYDHRFSKRTTVGVGYATIKNDSQAGGNQFVWSGMASTQNGSSLSAPLGSDISVWFVNIIHRF